MPSTPYDRTAARILPRPFQLHRKTERNRHFKKHEEASAEVPTYRAYLPLKNVNGHTKDTLEIRLAEQQHHLKDESSPETAMSGQEAPRDLYTSSQIPTLFLRSSSSSPPATRLVSLPLKRRRETGAHQGECEKVSMSIRPVLASYHCLCPIRYVITSERRESFPFCDYDRIQHSGGTTKNEVYSRYGGRVCWVLLRKLGQRRTLALYLEFDWWTQI